MRVIPFHSPLRGIALDDVWHDNDECPIGRSIAVPDRKKGIAPGRQRCTYCALLDRPAPVAKHRVPPLR